MNRIFKDLYGKQALQLAVWTTLALVLWLGAYRLSNKLSEKNQNVRITQELLETNYTLLKFYDTFFDIRTEFTVKGKQYTSIIQTLKSDKEKLRMLSDNSQNVNIKANLENAYETSDKIREQITSAYIAQEAVRGRNSELISDILFAESQIEKTLTFNADTFAILTLKSVIAQREKSMSDLQAHQFNELLALTDKLLAVVPDNQIVKDKIQTYKLYLQRYAEQLVTAGISETEQLTNAPDYELSVSEYYYILSELKTQFETEADKKQYYTILSYLLAIIPFVPLFFLIFRTERFHKQELNEIRKAAEKLTDAESDRSFETVRTMQIRLRFQTVNRIFKSYREAVAQFRNAPEQQHTFESAHSDDNVLPALSELSTYVTTRFAEYETIIAQKDKRYQFSEKLSEFNAILRNNLNTPAEISTKIVSALSDFLSIEIAGIYILRSTKTTQNLELAGAYAYNMKKEITRSFNLGEGLVGTCAAENNVIYLPEIQEDYLTITTAFGHLKPKHLYLYPIANKSKVLGVLELASVNSLDNEKTEFVKALCRDIALTFSFMQTYQD